MTATNKPPVSLCDLEAAADVAEADFTEAQEEGIIYLLTRRVDMALMVCYNGSMADGRPRLPVEIVAVSRQKSAAKRVGEAGKSRCSAWGNRHIHSLRI